MIREESLEIKTSQIPGTGLGLYTKVNIKKGDLISEFTGEFIDNKELEILLKQKSFYYLICWDEEKTLNVENSNCFAKYANDAKGFTRIDGLKNNAKIVWHEEKLFISATKKINSGQEIFVSYGKDYWDNL